MPFFTQPFIYSDFIQYLSVARLIAVCLVGLVALSCVVLRSQFFGPSVCSSVKCLSVPTFKWKIWKLALNSRSDIYKKLSVAMLRTREVKTCEFLDHSHKRHADAFQSEACIYCNKVTSLKTLLLLVYIGLLC